MPTIEEKRVYADKAGKTEVFVAGDAGIVVVDVSDDLVGGFSLEYRCAPRDVAAGGGDVAVATADDVVALSQGEFVETGFGAAAAVGFDDGDLLAADADGVVARLSRGEESPDEWVEIGTVEGDVRAIDGEFVATATGVYRAGGSEREGFDHVGLTDVHDVSAGGVPLAAAGDGLYTLGNGWMEALAGDFHVVASDGDAAHAATPDALYARETEWTPVDLPIEESIRDVDYAPAATLAVAADGTLLIESERGWRTQNVGVGETVGLAVR